MIQFFTKNLSFFFLLVLIIPILIFLMNIKFSKKSSFSYEKSSPFECGFDPLSFTRLPFSIQFFLISMIFLIFDIEITLLIPIVFILKTLSINLIIISLFFMFILIWGLYNEYMEKAIEWKY